MYFTSILTASVMATLALAAPYYTHPSTYTTSTSTTPSTSAYSSGSYYYTTIPNSPYYYSTSSPYYTTTSTYSSTTSTYSPSYTSPSSSITVSIDLWTSIDHTGSHYVGFAAASKCINLDIEFSNAVNSGTTQKESECFVFAEKDCRGEYFGIGSSGASFPFEVSSWKCTPLSLLPSRPVNSATGS